MKIVLIPARGGSKGVPDKNLKEVGGISLVVRAINAAKNSSADIVIVSTDSEKIATISRNAGAQVHNRSKINSGDSASSESVIMEVISTYEAIWPERSFLALLQPTSPFIEPQDIDACLEISTQGKVGFTAFENHSFAWEEVNGVWIPLGHPETHRPRRQELNRRVVETGACYAFPVDEFVKTGFRFCANPEPVMVSFPRNLEIDSLSDLEIAEFCNRYTKNNFELPLTLPKFIITDFDGCLTDDRVTVSSNGVESIVANRKDGLAIHTLSAMGVKVLILSSEKNDVVSHRAKKMGVNCLESSLNKLEVLERFVSESGLENRDIWYCGNDLNDLGIMNAGFYSFCPADATREVIENANHVLKSKGGQGILSEIAQLIKDKK